MEAFRLIAVALDDDENEELREHKKLGEYPRGRAGDDEVRIYPLSFSGRLSSYDGDKYDAWSGYYTCGGLPLLLTGEADELKSKYLLELFEKTYGADIMDRNRLRGDNAMEYACLRCRLADKSCEAGKRFPQQRY